MPSNKKLLQAAAGNAGESLYVEDVFSTYLYAGTGSAQTITNGIDLDGEGGLVWIKTRNVSSSNALFDTERGVQKAIYSNLTIAEDNDVNSITSFNSNGFTDNGSNSLSGRDYASWTFRKAEKFFDVVTYTGDSSSSTQISHSLGSTPGFIVCKRTSTSGGWAAYHASLGTGKYLSLNGTHDAVTDSAFFPEVTDGFFRPGSDNDVNGSGYTYVAYLFASDAGGFGDDESIIKCGSYTGNGGSGLNSINVGFEPQWVMVKNTSATGNWHMLDVMRGFSVAASGSGPFGGNPLYANLSNAEGSGTRTLNPTATGFEFSSGTAAFNNNGNTFIYIAIRRPMKTPESGTEVFTAVSQNTNTSAVTSGFPVDMVIMGDLPTTWGYNWSVSDRLRGGSNVLFTSSNAAENTGSNTTLDSNTGLTNGWVSGGTTGIFQMFKRATGFFDVVCFDGVNGATAFDHGLTVVPEMMIVKKRSAPSDWTVYHTGYPTPTTNQGALNLTGGSYANASFSTIPTSTQFTFNAYGTGTQVAYLFATLDGVSKVGSYTGTGSDLNVDCGFSAGARFILIKRTDSSGEWYVYDSERGIVAGNDPYLLLNTTAAQVTSTDYIDPLNAGFTVTSSAPAALNASGGTYIFMAIS